jgi:endonuclease/exonuclease/phosphatase family metal-dependent hydrolase
LSGLGYRHLVFVPQPGSAIGVAFLSRLPVLRTRALAVGELDGQPLRHIVEIEVLGRGRRLLVLNNHWKSRSEGDLQTAPGRRRAEEVLARRVRQLLAEDPGVDLVAVGDFNENLEELASWTSQAGFYDPWVELPPRERGSAAFRGAWQTPDHALLAPGLLDERGFFYRRGDFRVLRPAFLLDRGSGLPRRFAAGGASDHLPLVLRLHLAGAP